MTFTADFVASVDLTDPLFLRACSRLFFNLFCGMRSADVAGGRWLPRQPPQRFFFFSLYFFSLFIMARLHGMESDAKNFFSRLTGSAQIRVHLLQCADDDYRLDSKHLVWHCHASRKK
jgi:hypothetical protein